MAGIPEIKFDSIDVSSFEVSPGGGATPTVIVVVGKGHPRPFAISLSAEALFGLASAAFGACERIDKPRVDAMMRKIFAAYAAAPSDGAAPVVDDGGTRDVAAQPADWGSIMSPALDAAAQFQKLCRDRGISDAMSASLLESMIGSDVMKLVIEEITKRSAEASGSANAGDSDDEGPEK